jgi:hypothetical protein
VTGHVVAHDDAIHLSVVLDTGKQIETIRQERLPIPADTGELRDLSWYADQYTQETIGNELTVLGWEAIAEEPSAPSPSGTGVSAAYLVRRIG